MDENNIVTNQIDTSTFADSMVTPTSHVDGMNKSTIPWNDVTLPTFKNPAIVDFTQQARYDVMSRMAFGSSTNGADSVAKSMFPDYGKRDLTTEVDIRDTHTKLSNSNTWIPKYESYMPGVDNDARLSAQQSSTEKFFNPLMRLGANTMKAPLDIVGSVYGIGAAALSGRFDAIYDNDYMHWLDNWGERTNFDFKNYYTEEQRNSNLGLNMQTWDKVLGGAEFTTRLLAAEGLLAVATGGASVPASFAKTALSGGSKMARILDKGADATKALRMLKGPETLAAAKIENNVGKAVPWLKQSLNSAANRGQFGDVLVKTRFAVTSPLYEAGFESRHFQKEVENNFWEYHRLHGTEPTPDQITDFSKKLEGAANGVFMTNMAILAPSNLAMMGNVLNLSNPLAKAVSTSGKGVSEKLFGMGIKKTAEGFKALSPTKLQKTMAYVTPLAKSMFTEGVFEEGGQGIASNTFKNYVASSYDPKYTKNTANYIDAFGKAFEDQFGTKEGREEMIIGAIIGSIFGGVGTLRGANSVANQYKKQEAIAETFNKGQAFADEYAQEGILSLFSQGNRYQYLQEQLQKADETGDNIGKASLQAQSFVSLLDAYHSVGKAETFMETMESVIKGLDPQTIAEQTGIDISEVQDYKSEQIQSMREMSDSYGKALKAGRYIFGRNTAGTEEIELKDKDGNVVGKRKVNGELLANSLAFASTMAHFNQKFALESFDAIQTKVAQVMGGQQLVERLGAIGVLKSMGQIESAQLDNLNKEINNHKAQIAKITNKIATLQSGENKSQSAAKIVELADELRLAQEQFTQANQKADALWKTSVDNFYSKMGKTGVYAQRPDLDTFSDQVKDIDNSLNNLPLNANDRLILDQLFKQFERANTSYKSFVDMATKIENSDFTPKTFKGWFGGVRAKAYDKSVNDHTKDTLADIFEFNKDKRKADTLTEMQFAPNVFTEDKLSDDYKPTARDISSIIKKLDRNKSLNDIEQKFYEKYKEGIESVRNSKNEDPLNDTSEDTVIDELYISKRAKEQELYNLRNGNFTDDIQKYIDEAEAAITKLDEEITELQKTDTSINADEDAEIMRLNQEIEVLERKIEQLERQTPNPTKRSVITPDTNYQQYEYVKPNGDTVVGYLEINKGILQIVNEDEIVDIEETPLALRNVNTSSIKGLKKIEEDDVLIEGKEVYVNGKIYKLGLKNPTMNESISKDKDGNYQVTLQARNGRMITFKGSIADALVYQNLLNELENEATEERIRELIEQAERDATIEREYEKLASKTEDRDSRISEIEQEQLNNENSKQESIEDKRVEKSEVRRTMMDAVIDRELQLEDEIAVMNGEITIEEKLDRLRTEVQEIRNELIDTPTDDRLNTLLTKTEIEIARIEKERQNVPFNPNGTPSEQLEWVVKNIEDLEFENIDAAANFERPSQEEIDEYIELVKTTNKNSTQRKRTAELREKLTPFLLADNLSLDGINIIDLIDLYNQAQHVKTLNTTQTPITSEEDLKVNIREVEETSLREEHRSQKVGLVYDGAYIKKRNGMMEISHIRLETMLLGALEAGHSPIVRIVEKDAKGNTQTVEEIPVTFQNMEDVGRMFDNRGGVSIELTPEMTLMKDQNEVSFRLRGEVQPFLEMIGMRAYAITGQPTDYILLYEEKIDGSLGPKEAEYRVMNNGVEMLFNKEVLNGLSPGDTVTLEFDPTDDYNQTLSKKEYASKGNIYVKKNGELVQILKASRVKDNTDADSNELHVVRKSVVENPGKPIEIKIEQSYLGLPIITLNADGTAREIPVDEEAVVAYGYVNENGELKGDIENVEIDNQQYVEPMSRSGRNTPVAAFKSNGKTLLFPINLKPKGVDLSGDVDTIMSDNTKSIQRKMIEINSLMESHDLLNSETALTDINFNLVEVKQLLSSVYDRIDVTNMDEIKNADKTAFIDFKNPFMSNKLKFDFTSAKPAETIKTVGKATVQIVKSTVSTKNGVGLKIAEDEIC